MVALFVTCIALICQQNNTFYKQLSNDWITINGLVLLAESPVYDLEHKGMRSPLCCLTGIRVVHQMLAALRQPVECRWTTVHQPLSHWPKLRLGCIRLIQETVIIPDGAFIYGETPLALSVSVLPQLLRSSFHLAGDDSSSSAQQTTTNQLCVSTRVFLWADEERSWRHSVTPLTHSDAPVFSFAWLFPSHPHLSLLAGGHVPLYCCFIFH